MLGLICYNPQIRHNLASSDSGLSMFEVTLISMVLFLIIFLLWKILGWAMHWGATSEDRVREMPGDELLNDPIRSKVVMTRAVNIPCKPERIWPWIAQLGRGAGFYSYDFLDDGGKKSARHLVSWIPEPQLGDATAIGYIRHLEKGKSLTWWLDEGDFLGAAVRLIVCFQLDVHHKGGRVVCRISADAQGLTAPIALFVFEVIDSIMACRQLAGLKKRVLSAEVDQLRFRELESGKRDQYQLYEVLFANGQGAGVKGKEGGTRFRESASQAGFIKDHGIEE